MTRAPRSAPLAARGPDDIVAALREAGGRLSAPRRLVLEALFAAEGPISAEYIAQSREGRPALELTSIYRTLEQLEELGAVRHVHIGHGPGMYALVGAQETEYLACERCDRVTSVDSSRLDPVRAQLRELFGYEVRFAHFPAMGLCQSCAAGEHGADEHEHEHRHRDRIHTHPHAHPAGDGHAHDH